MCKKKSSTSGRERARIRRQKIHQYLPCFFDVPAADVQEILRISHHTLDPVRRSLGLQKWPFMDVTRNRFCMSADEIASLRSSMMAVADAEMRETLRQMDDKARECKEFMKMQARHRLLKRSRKPKKEQPNPEKPEQRADVPKTEQLEQLITANLQLIEEGPSLETLIDNAMLPGDTQFWQEISQILSSPSQPCKREEEVHYPFSAVELDEPCPSPPELYF